MVSLNVAIARLDRDVMNDLVEMILRRSLRRDDCRLWNGYVLRNGYGQIRLPSPVSRNVLVHRVIWSAVYGLIGKGRIIRHRCDRRPCCEITHLLDGTDADNAMDREERNRTARGSAIGKAKLKECDIPRIRARLASGENRASIGRDYDVDRATIRALDNGVTWRHVPMIGGVDGQEE